MGITCSSRAPLPILAIHAAVERNAAEAARSRAEEDLAARARADQAALHRLMHILHYSRSAVMFSCTDLQSPALPDAFTGGNNSEFRKDSSAVAIVSTPPVNMNPSPPETALTEDPVEY